jgi:hypothetical protein
MKYAIVIASLLFLTAATADVSGKLAQEGKTNQTTEKSKPKKSKPPMRADIDGKPGKAKDDGKPAKAKDIVVAQRQLSDGRIVTYQQNEKDVAELVKGLKEDGVTDAKLLDPKMWLMWSCQAYGYKKCSGKCGSQQCAWTQFNVETARLSKPGASIYHGGYCACR